MAATLNIDEVAKAFFSKEGPPKYSGKSTQELQEFQLNLETNCDLFGVPQEFVDTFTDPDMERSYDPKLNLRLYNLLFQTTTGAARRIVLRHRLSRDGRAACAFEAA